MAPVRKWASSPVLAAITILAWSSTVSCQNQCDNTIFPDGTSNYVTSPGYPYNYANNLDCAWISTAKSPSQVVVLNLQDFYLEGSPPLCSNDYMIIYDGNTSSSPIIQKLCGQVPSTQIPASGMYMRIVFHSDSTLSYKGFKFNSLSKEKPAQCNVNLAASTSAKYLSSSNYPWQYPSNMDCKWVIIADFTSLVVLDISAFSLDESLYCASDYVKIYDGSSTSSSLIETLCGSHNYGTYKSTGSSMTVVFHSDGVISDKTGFKFSYKSQASDSSGTIDFSSSTSTRYSIYLPGYIAAPICVIVVGLISAVCCRRRVVNRQRRATQVVRSEQILTTGQSPSSATNITANQNVSHANVFFVTFDSNNQAEASMNTESHKDTSETQPTPQPTQAPREPPRYSSLNSDMNASLPFYDPRYPDYRAMNPPPAYFGEAAGAAPFGQKPLPFDPKPEKSLGLGSSSDKAGYANMGFSSDAATGPATSSHRDTEPSAPVRDSLYNN